IIEEGPIIVAPMETVKKLGQAARRLAKCVNYVGAATVEYLYSMDSGKYYFLELNPRLQVEHPVTEWIAEVNLPAAQVAVGMGIPLCQISAESVRPKGHCVSVSVTSEDPDDGFKPTGGKVQELSFKRKPSSWAYFSVKSGGGIHEFSDFQFGSLIEMVLTLQMPKHATCSEEEFLIIVIFITLGCAWDLHIQWLCEDILHIHYWVWTTSLVVSLGNGGERQILLTATICCMKNSSGAMRLSRHILEKHLRQQAPCTTAAVG
ncbi:hypothetical protein C5167_025853, partial [Papaver somniferum]